MEQKFGGIIWTNHALERLQQRQIKQGDAWTTWKRPDHSRYAQTKNAWVFYRSFGQRIVEVVAKKNDRGEWVVLSVWDKPAHANYRRKERKAQQSFWGQLRRLIGL